MEPECGYWIIVPPHITAAEDLTNTEKLVAGRIIGLCNKHGYCYASNGWLADCLGMDVGTISNTIARLVKKGYFLREIIYKPGTKEVDQRRLFPNFSLKMDTPPHFYEGEVPTQKWIPLPTQKWKIVLEIQVIERTLSL